MRFRYQKSDQTSVILISQVQVIPTNVRPPSIMKLVGCTFLLLFNSHVTSFNNHENVPINYSLEALDYILQIIEYEISIEPGAFSCVFYNVASQNYDDNVMHAVLESPRLDRVAKYVITRDYRDGRGTLPASPSMLLLYPGDDAEYYELQTTKNHLNLVLSSIDPTTKVLVFANHTNMKVALGIAIALLWAKVISSCYVDSVTAHGLQCNRPMCWNEPRMQRPMYLFSWVRRRFEGHNIYYVKSSFSPAPWNERWVNETARYLNTESVVYQHSCKGCDIAFYQCVEAEEGEFDIILNPLWIKYVDYDVLCTSNPSFWRIAVPRDRPLNVAELLIMPFKWQVWTLLVTVLIASEVVKQLYPNLLRNDPILLAVCGFERHDLHRAGPIEKLFFISLIILMFFMSNAFESKILSLMTNKPSIQRIKTLTDLFKSDIRFYEDLENNPHFRNFSVIGELMVQGESGTLEPGVGAYWRGEWVDLLEEVNFDYDRMQPFYVVLDYAAFEDPECYSVQWRSPFAKTFQFMHITLVETGLFDLWKRQHKDELRSMYIGRRPRVSIQSKVDLNFEDLRPAWMVLMLGLCIGTVVFLVELFRKRFQSWLLYKFGEHKLKVYVRIQKLLQVQNITLLTPSEPREIAPL